MAASRPGRRLRPVLGPLALLLRSRAVRLGRQEPQMTIDHTDGTLGGRGQGPDGTHVWSYYPEPRDSMHMCAAPVTTATRNRCTFLSRRLCQGINNQTITKLRAERKELPGKCLHPVPTCALVGSSANLLNASFGAEIDKHHRVIRLNSAMSGTSEDPKIQRLGQFVGTRTDVRFVNMYGKVPEEDKKLPVCVFLHEPAVPCAGHADGPFKMCYRSPRMCHPSCNPGAFLRKKGSLMCRAHGQVPARIEPDWGKNHVFLDTAHGDFAEEIGQNLKPTAGFKALVYAMSTCKELSVYGFGPSCDGHVGRRYYDAPDVIEKFHPYNDELRFLQEAAAKGLDALMPSWLKNFNMAKKITLNMPKCSRQAQHQAARDGARARPH